MEGGVTRAVAIATWALVWARGDVLGGVATLRSCAACHFLMHSHLAESVGIMLVGVTLLCTLGTDGCTSMERVILFGIIRVGCGHTWRQLHPRNSWHVGCLHPWNSLHVGGSGGWVVPVHGLLLPL